MIKTCFQRPEDGKAGPEGGCAPATATPRRDATDTPALELCDLGIPGRLGGISLNLPAGKLCGLLGPNGSGKSTLLQCAAGVLPCRGRIRWAGRDLDAIPALERGRHTAWVPQDASFEFGFTVQSVISQGRYAHGDDGKGVREAMERLDLAPLAARPVNRLSGGERQRVLLARAVTTGAPLQLWDEPLAQLDPRHVLETLALARELASRPGASLLLSLHDLSLARELDWLILLENGLLRAAGPPARILTPALLHSVFRVHATVAPGFALTL